MTIGIDVGSKFIKVSSDNKDNISYKEHHGSPEKILSGLYENGLITKDAKVVLAGHYSEFLSGKLPGSETCDEVASIVEFAKKREIHAKYIVNVGAGSIRYIKLKENGDFKSYRENTLCAAGTGSFLDEQMHRMGFSYESLAEMNPVKEPPHIATRCAVFAKSDLIHRQQEGYTIEEMWNGLCRGVVTTMLHNVFKGNIPKERVAFCGGIFKNRIIREWITHYIPNPYFPENGEYAVSIGAMLLGSRQDKTETSSKNTGAEVKPESRFQLRVDKSTVYKTNTIKDYIDDGNEVRIHREPANGDRIVIGIDIGSTSTKAVILDASNKEVIIDIYRKTGGNPIYATSKLFKEIRNIYKGTDFEVVSTGTTGSGRKLIGKIIGADLIVNEITAHFKGANHFDSGIETIFEIGGQDAKYIRGSHGSVVDSNMNYVCAAGTGSFIEEQANRLGFDIREIGDKVINLFTPHTSDRCTVFMEQDINKLLRDGYTREEVLSGVIRSIVKNYLNRVVGSRPVTGEKIFFQGATARNNGLVAAFEMITGKEIIVSPYCHVMGAFGAGILSLEAVRSKQTSFRGIDIFENEIKLSYSVCEKCANRCKISVAVFADGRRELWGFMCGKESFEENRKAKGEDYFRTVEKLAIREAEKLPKPRGTVGIPRCLSMYTYMPLWTEFFRRLNFNVIVSPRTSEKEKELGVTVSRADFCFPLKISLGQSSALAGRDDIDAIFYPTVISEVKQKNGKPRIFCPYVISYPSLLKNEFGAKKLIAPELDFRFNEGAMAKALTESLRDWNIPRSEIKAAYRAGMSALKEFYRNRYELGHRILKKVRDENVRAIVAIGRPYNLYDSMINLKLPEHIAEKDNLTVIPYECLLDPADNDSELLHVYWNYGEKILYAAEKIRKLDNIYPVYFTNFGCGPDSFILTRFENIMRGKPYLIIELDEHASDTGYMTRIEAFLDVIFDENKKKENVTPSEEKFFSVWRQKERKLWFPPLHEFSGRLLAAAFRSWGFDAVSLDDENIEAYEIGKQNVRGSECLPASTTIGVFIKKMKEIGADPKKHALFMPTADGPCRFGQYMVLHRNILNLNNMEDVEIFAPSSTNSYMGMPEALRLYSWDVVLASDMLFKYICKIRPYEVEKGSVDRAKLMVLEEMEKGIEERKPTDRLLLNALKKLSQVKINKVKKPLVGIVGEIYVRNNHFCNDNLIRYIEDHGGEAWLSPTSEWFLYTSFMEKYFAKLYGQNILKRGWIGIKTKYLFSRMHKIEKAVKPYLADRMEPDLKEVMKKGEEYLPLIFEGEAILTMGRSVKFLEGEADMVVNCAPFGCMPGNVTASMLSNLKDIKKPAISLFYDGESDMNRIVGIYLKNLSG